MKDLFLLQAMVEATVEEWVVLWEEWAVAWVVWEGEWAEAWETWVGIPTTQHSKLIHLEGLILTTIFKTISTKIDLTVVTLLCLCDKCGLLSNVYSSEMCGMTWENVICLT